MPLQATSGAASYDAFGGGVPVAVNYIEDVFSTYLYQADGSSAQTINNGIDLSGKGGLVWIKSRDTGSTSNNLIDTVRGSPNVLQSNLTSAQENRIDEFGSFLSTGFTLPYNTIYGETNYATRTYVSWTFREQPKFFDVLTFTGNGTAGRTVAHNLGSAPGCIIVKRTDTADGWAVYHRSLGATKYIFLNQSNASGTYSGYWNNTEPTSSVFSVGNDAAVNASGGTYVAYLFAHDAGGFGLTGTDNVISCGSYTTNGSGNATVTLGYEPQFFLEKRSDNTSNWNMFDSMRGMSYSDDLTLKANTSGAEVSQGTSIAAPTATGMAIQNRGASQTIIYIAIRRGPMKVPTSGTSVFALGGTASSTLTTSFAVDAFIQNSLTSSAANSRFCSRLQGSDLRLVTSSTDAEAADNGDSQFGGKSYAIVGAGGGIVFGFGRAPSFFDEVCYKPPSSAVNTYVHNLGAIPELMIIKTRDSARRWVVYTQPTGNTQALHLNTADAVNSTGNNYFNSTSPTASVFTLNNNFGDVCNGGGFGVAYLFATCAGVSKVGSYTGTATTKQIDCGFTGGARFVLIKKTSGTGSWYVWDSARGIVSGNDPYLLLNSTAAEVTNTDYIDTYSAGFEISSTAPSEINENGGSFIFLAIA